jgi:dienelactone hydrolase
MQDDPEAPIRRAQLHALLGRLPPVDWVMEARESVVSAPDQYRCERLALRSRAGAKSRAFLTGPSGDWRGLPAIIYCHAHGNRYAIGAAELIEGRPALIDPPYGETLAAAGIVALAIDLPCFGNRATESESAEAKRHFWQGTTLFGQMLAELAGLLPVLKQIGGVDPARIGTMGISMGGTLAFWLAALEPRIRAVAQLCVFADIETLVRTGGHDLHGIYMTVPGLNPACSTGAIAGLAAPRPQFVAIGREDPLTPPDAFATAAADLTEAYARSGAADALAIHAFDGVGHHETPQMRREVMEFLAANL